MEGREEGEKEEGADSVCQTSKPVIFLSVHAGSGEYRQAVVYQINVYNRGKELLRYVQKENVLEAESWFQESWRRGSQSVWVVRVEKFISICKNKGASRRIGDGRMSRIWTLMEDREG